MLCTRSNKKVARKCSSSEESQAKMRKTHHNPISSENEGQNNFCIRCESYVQSLAITLNNVGVLLQQMAEDEIALDQMIEALQLAAHSLAEEKDHLLNFYENNTKLGKCLFLINFGLGKVLEAASREDTRRQRRQSAMLLCFHARQAFFIAEAIKLPIDCENLDFAIVVMLHNIGLIHYKQGCLDLAKKHLEAALDFLPNDDTYDDSCLQGRWIFGIVFNNLGHIYRFQGQDGNAMMAFEEAFHIVQEETTEFLDTNEQQHCSGPCYESNSVINKYFGIISHNLGLVRNWHNLTQRRP